MVSKKLMSDTNDVKETDVWHHAGSPGMMFKETDVWHQTLQECFKETDVCHQILKE